MFSVPVHSVKLAKTKNSNVKYSHGLSQNQQMHKIISKFNIYCLLLCIFWQKNCHPQGVFFKGLEELTVSCYIVRGFIVEGFTHVTIYVCRCSR